ncbi:paraquat-inducible protein A [Ralstonia insidiosa]|uniref:Paraquat-inducible protein A n=1 Tax=Ralstonia insidiosa TaxID=190721 RepID=A0A848NX53_9RALS|nr:paraquat-inducible protein A [Ralstonia insidiosa]NMV37074.1 paraquat-inducible protein A [Ralstonia insidiosa]
MESTHLIACHECDRVFRRPPLSDGLHVRCSRCANDLSGAHHARPTLDFTCAMAVAAVVTLVIAQCFPIIALKAQGMASQATLLDAVSALWAGQMRIVAAVVFFTTTLFPAMELIALLYVLLPLRAGAVPPGFRHVIRFLQWLRPWGMIEVFMLGVLVTTVKMVSLARVIPGAGLFAFGALTVLLALVSRFNPHRLWHACDEIEAPDGATPSAELRTDALKAVSAKQAGLVVCHTCGSVQPLVSGEAHQRCHRCRTALHERRPASISRTAALLLAAALLYIPANLLPVMHSTSLGRSEDDTILSGVAYFWTSGDWGLAAVVFIASVVVPMLKLAILALLVFAAHRRSTWRPHERTRLYRLVERIGRWSMLDVFVVALTVALVHFGSFAVITAGPGALAFGAVVILTMIASMQFDPRLIWDPVPDDAESARDDS